MKRKVFLLIIIFCSLTMYSQTLEKTLFESKKDNYQLDTACGSLRIGNLFDKKTKNAVVVELDSTKTYHLSIYTECSGNWKLIFHQDSISSFSKIAFRDFNFDGKKDLALICNQSSGTSVLEVKLWLNASNNHTFKYISDIDKIGTPTIDNQHKAIFGFTACCEFQEITLNKYVWEKEKLVLRQKIEIETYQKRVKAVEKQFKPDNSEIAISEIKKKMQFAEINKLIKKYNSFKD